jgi:tetratricopeptide (TPR) repeat protein
MEPLYRAHPEDARYAVSLGGNCNNQALLMRNRGDAQGALPFHDRAVAVLLDAHRRNPTNAGCSHNCAMALGSRAVTRMGLKDYKNALADWELLMEVVGPVEAEKYRHYRVLTLVQMGEHRQAGEEIEKMLRRPNISGDERYNCVCVLSQLVTAVSKDTTLTREQRRRAEDAHIARALSLLTQLRADGFFRDPAKQRLLDDDEDLAALRRRGEIKRWREKQ